MVEFLNLNNAPTLITPPAGNIKYKCMHSHGYAEDFTYIILKLKDRGVAAVQREVFSKILLFAWR